MEAERGLTSQPAHRPSSEEGESLVGAERRGKEEEEEERERLRAVMERRAITAAKSKSGKRNPEKYVASMITF